MLFYFYPPPSMKETEIIATKERTEGEVGFW